MKKFAVVSKNDEVSIKVGTTIQKQLIENGLEYDDLEPDYVCVIGGDGTFLSAVHKYIDRTDKTLFTGIHTGTLGFLINYSLKDIKQYVIDITEKEPTIEKRKLLKISLDDGKEYYAVNEMRLESYKNKQITVKINDEELETFSGVGIAVSTQLGSTAYNRSLGGALVQPGLDIMQICEISPIRNKHYRSLLSPVIVSGDTNVEISCEDLTHTVLCFDRYDIPLHNHQTINCTLTDKSLMIAHYSKDLWTNHLKQLI